MAKIKPFYAVTFNPQNISDLSTVVCPPYDVITSEEQEIYYKLSPYNLIRLILGKDTAEEDRYKSAARYFKEWLQQGILIQEKEPAIYFYNQIYQIKGERKNRLGFIALLKLDDDKNVIFPHESTRFEPKEDRYRLLKSVKANLSPIFVVFSDTARIIQRSAERYLKNNKPFIDIVDREGVRHQVWRISDKDTVDKIVLPLQDKQMFIADGHHRYEVALTFRDKMRKAGHLDPEADFNYIMAYFTNVEAKGLTILPIHRLVKYPRGFNFDDFRKELEKYFDLEEIKDKDKFFFLMQKAGERQNTLGMYKDNKFFLLRLKNLKVMDRILGLDRIKEYRNLDITIFNSLILKKMLGIDIEDKDKIYFSHKEEELIRQANDDKNSILFLFNPVKIEQLISVARQKECMPSKSTYFYPKVISGLVINKFNM
ncbi:MAG: DUF1015 domain-containing protein [Candidatus Omnitrophica bacterium]|nr:DUF1015 domain-containing protein [Candidatus Omnitrophota bacterium]